MTKTIEWLAVLISIYGAVLTVIGIDPYNIYVLNLGSLLWVIWGFLERKYSIIIVNFGMLSIYVMGTAHRMGLFDSIDVSKFIDFFSWHLIESLLYYVCVWRRTQWHIEFFKRSPIGSFLIISIFFPIKKQNALGIFQKDQKTPSCLKSHFHLIPDTESSKNWSWRFYHEEILCSY